MSLKRWAVILAGGDGVRVRSLTRLTQFIRIPQAECIMSTSKRIESASLTGPGGVTPH